MAEGGSGDFGDGIANGFSPPFATGGASKGLGPTGRLGPLPPNGEVPDAGDSIGLAHGNPCETGADGFSGWLDSGRETFTGALGGVSFPNPRSIPDGAAFGSSQGLAPPMSKAGLAETEGEAGAGGVPNAPNGESVPFGSGKPNDVFASGAVAGATLPGCPGPAAASSLAEAENGFPTEKPFDGTGPSVGEADAGAEKGFEAAPMAAGTGVFSTEAAEEKIPGLAADSGAAPGMGGRAASDRLGWGAVRGPKGDAVGELFQGNSEVAATGTSAMGGCDGFRGRVTSESFKGEISVANNSGHTL